MPTYLLVLKEGKELDTDKLHCFITKQLGNDHNVAISIMSKITPIVRLCLPIVAGELLEQSLRLMFSVREMFVSTKDDIPDASQPSEPAESSDTPIVVQNVPFLRLPAEILNRIFRYAVVCETTLILPDRHSGGLVLPYELPINPGLLQTCRQIRAEASDIFYSENAFEAKVSSHRETIRLTTDWPELNEPFERFRAYGGCTLPTWLAASSKRQQVDPRQVVKAKGLFSGSEDDLYCSCVDLRRWIEACYVKEPHRWPNWRKDDLRELPLGMSDVFYMFEYLQKKTDLKWEHAEYVWVKLNDFIHCLYEDSVDRSDKRRW